MVVCHRLLIVFVIELIIRVRPFAILRLERLGAYPTAHIADNAGGILVALAQQTVAPDGLQVELAIELTRLGIDKLEFADELRETLLLTAQTDTLGGDAWDIGEEDDGRCADERHKLVLTRALTDEHEHEEGHEHAGYHEVETTLGEAVQTDAVEGAYPVHDERRNGYEREMTVEPVVVPLTEYRLCHTTHQSHSDEAHDQPCHTALRQVPLDGNLDEIGIKDNGVDDDGRREDEVQDEPEYLERLLHLVFILTDKGAAHLRRHHKGDELEDMLEEARGLFDAEDIEEGGRDGQYGQIEHADND